VDHLCDTGHRETNQSTVFQTNFTSHDHFSNFTAVTKSTNRQLVRSRSASVSEMNITLVCQVTLALTWLRLKLQLRPLVAIGWVNESFDTDLKFMRYLCGYFSFWEFCYFKVSFDFYFGYIHTCTEGLYVLCVFLVMLQFFW